VAVPNQGCYKLSVGVSIENGCTLNDAVLGKPRRYLARLLTRRADQHNKRKQKEFTHFEDAGCCFTLRKETNNKATSPTRHQNPFSFWSSKNQFNFGRQNSNPPLSRSSDNSLFVLYGTVDYCFICNIE
jgi:hypothetical protein